MLGDGHRRRATPPRGRRRRPVDGPGRPARPAGLRRPAGGRPRGDGRPAGRAGRRRDLLPPRAGPVPPPARRGHPGGPRPDRPRRDLAGLERRLRHRRGGLLHRHDAGRGRPRRPAPGAGQRPLGALPGHGPVGDLPAVVAAGPGVGPGPALSHPARRLAGGRRVDPPPGRVPSLQPGPGREGLGGGRAPRPGRDPLPQRADLFGRAVGRPGRASAARGALGAGLAVRRRGRPAAVGPRAAGPRHRRSRRGLPPLGGPGQGPVRPPVGPAMRAGTGSGRVDAPRPGRDGPRAGQPRHNRGPAPLRRGDRGPPALGRAAPPARGAAAERGRRRRVGPLAAAGRVPGSDAGRGPLPPGGGAGPGDAEGARRAFRNAHDLCAALPAGSPVPLADGLRVGDLAASARALAAGPSESRR